MSFLLPLAASLGKKILPKATKFGLTFGKGLFKDIFSGKNVLKSIGRRGLESLKTVINPKSMSNNYGATVLPSNLEGVLKIMAQKYLPASIPSQLQGIVTNPNISSVIKNVQEIPKVEKVIKRLIGKKAIL